MLKILAVLFMICDHIAVINLILFVSHSQNMLFAYNILRKIGRISFPIFLFCILDGLMYTKNINHYTLRIASIGIISIIPYSLAFHNTFFYIQQFNILITFSILLLCFGFFAKYISGNGNKKISYSILIGACIISCIITRILHCEYGTDACICAFILLLFKNNRIGRILCVAYLSVFNNILCLCALPFLLIYNGEKNKNKVLDRAFYFFYPVHLILLYTLKSIL